jgi:predicted transglutaminase-like cysteine proteinase
MGIYRSLRALRAFVFAGTMACVGTSSALIAGPLKSSGAELADIAAHPFGLSATVTSYGTLQEKWLAVQRRLDDEMVQIALCEGDRERCVSPAALRYLAIVDAGRTREGRARLGEINRAINLAVRPMSDLVQYGKIDLWSSPLVTFTSGAGDCEDYAIAKFVALRLAGVSLDDLRIVIMQDTIHDEAHAVAAARLDGHWLMLDNRRMPMIEDADVKNYRPTFVIDQSGVKEYLNERLLAISQSAALQLEARNSAPLSN